MGAVYFYHLTRSALDQALSMLLDRALGAGWRVAVRGQAAARLDWLDQRLWLGPEEGFLPHGLAGGPQDASQPVLLTTGALPDGCACLMAVDGAEVTAAEVAETERCCILFDGNDPAAVARARQQWKMLTGAGLAALYWSEESGRWQKKAESAGAGRQTAS
ncbi:MAG: DNA polymerase III subunit chi [Rhodobacteraceae bacterium]|nr:DNA polymerase III subunit chi [Paracoccaceae bacterium]